MRVKVGERKAWEAMTDAIFVFRIFLKEKERTKNRELKERKKSERERIERGCVLEA
jgi:hypothetical protein